MAMTKTKSKKRQFARSLKSQSVAPWEGKREHIGRLGDATIPVTQTVTIKFDVIDNVGHYDNWYTAVVPIEEQEKTIVEWVYTNHNFHPETHSIYLPHSQKYIG